MKNKFDIIIVGAGMAGATIAAYLGKQGKKIAFSLDIFNLPNLISKKLGRLVYAPNVVNSSYRLIDFKAIENNRPVFEFKEQTGKPWQVDNLNSRWKAQFGVHYSF